MLYKGEVKAASHTAKIIQRVKQTECSRHCISYWNTTQRMKQWARSYDLKYQQGTKDVFMS